MGNLAKTNVSFSRITPDVVRTQITLGKIKSNNHNSFIKPFYHISEFKFILYHNYYRISNTSFLMLYTAYQTDHLTPLQALTLITVSFDSFLLLP